MKLKILKEHMGERSGNGLYQRYYYGNYGELLITLTEVDNEQGKGYRYVLGYEDSLDTKEVGPTTIVTDQPVFHTVKDFWVEDVSDAQKEFDKLCAELKKRYHARDTQENIAYWDKYYGRKTESLLTEDLDSSYNYYKDKIDRKTFDKLVRLDPTFNEDKNKMGTYGKWILARYIAGTDVKTNQGHVKDCLTRFEDAKKNLDKKDIMQYKSLAEIDAALGDDSNYNDIGHNAVAKNDHIWGNDLCDVYTPSTFEAAQKIGLPCAWCTSNDRYYYDYYKRRYGGEYYIILPKKATHNDEKYQFHFESEQFMDVHDNPCSIAVVVDKFHLYDCPQMVKTAQEYVDENEDDVKYRMWDIWSDGNKSSVSVVSNAFHLPKVVEVPQEYKDKVVSAVNKMISRDESLGGGDIPGSLNDMLTICQQCELNDKYDEFCDSAVEEGNWYWELEPESFGVLLVWAKSHGKENKLWETVKEHFDKFFYGSTFESGAWVYEEYKDKITECLKSVPPMPVELDEYTVEKALSDFTNGFADAVYDYWTGEDMSSLDEFFYSHDGIPNGFPTDVPEWFLPHIEELGLTKEQFIKISQNELDDLTDENGDPLDVDVDEIRGNMESAYAQGVAQTTSDACMNDFEAAFPGKVTEGKIYVGADEVFDFMLDEQSDETFEDSMTSYVEDYIRKNFTEPYYGWWESPDDDTYFEILADML